jgi:hypothetical protein
MMTSSKHVLKDSSTGTGASAGCWVSLILADASKVRKDLPHFPIFTNSPRLDCSPFFVNDDNNNMVNALQLVPMAVS